MTPLAEAVPGSGLGPDTEVSWTVARDKAFTDVVSRGSLTASAASDHTVKADIRGLEPATDYWFRFSAGGTDSPTARTRTAPAADANVTGLRFGVVTCANWEAGYFASYRHLAARGDLDAWLHLGDYIYEYKSGEYGTRGTVVRPHAPLNEIITLSDYRTRHGKYKTDPDLQALHLKAPVIAIWDDHEFADNAWSGGAVNHTEGAEGTWTARQAAAKQAYFEWMPVRPAIAGTTYRRLRFGKLADLSLLDLRSFRSQQASSGSGSVDDPDRTITGRAQLDWLKAGLKASDTKWRLVGNSVMIAPFVIGSLTADLLKPLAKLLDLPQDGIGINTDQWDGYTDDRRELLAHLRSNAIGNTVFLTGDIHMSWANDVPVDAGTYPLSPSAATVRDHVGDLRQPRRPREGPRGHGLRARRPAHPGRQPARPLGRHRPPRLRRPRHHGRARADGLLRPVRPHLADRDLVLGAFVPHAQRHAEGGTDVRPRVVTTSRGSRAPPARWSRRPPRRSPGGQGRCTGDRLRRTGRSRRRRPPCPSGGTRS